MFVESIAALKINVKVDWSSRPFSQNFNIRINHGFSCIDVSLVPRGILKTEGDRSGGYRGNLDQSIVHGRVVDACCPAICCVRTSASTGQAKETSCRISKLYQNNDVCIDWPMCSTDISTVEHVYDMFACFDRGFDA